MVPRPPISKLSKPLVKRVLSRICSASSRMRGPRASSLFSGSLRSSSGDTEVTCWKASEVRSSFISFLTSQPLERKSEASQSRSSGWKGSSPWVPRSPLDFTMPVPNTCCQNLLTITREVRGCSGETSQLARSSLSARF